MRIGIDITPLTAQPTGVGRYLGPVIEHMGPMLGEDSLTGWATGLHAPAHGAGGLSRRYLPLPTRALWAWWRAVPWPPVDSLLGGVDVFHATNYHLPPVARARRVLTIYDLAFMVEPRWASPKIVGPFARRVPRFAREADAIITCSMHSREDIVRLCGVAPDKVRVVHGAVGPDMRPVDRDIARARMRELLGLDAPYVLHVGTIESRKNIETLARAFALSCKGHPHRLLLVGMPGWNMDHFGELVAREGLADRVLMPGYLPSREDLAAAYSAADLFVMPSHYEGFGLPALEAMACGCPVLVSDSSSLPEVGGDAAGYFPAMDAQALAARMGEVLENPELAGEMSRRGTAQAARFDWTESARRTLEVYRSLA